MLAFTLFRPVSAQVFIDLTAGPKIVFDQVEVEGGIVDRVIVSLTTTELDGAIVGRRMKQMIVSDAEGRATEVLVQIETTITPNRGQPGMFTKKVTTETLRTPLDSNKRPIGPQTSATETVTETDVRKADFDLPSKTKIVPLYFQLNPPTPVGAS